MVDRRGFIASLLAAPLVRKVAAKASDCRTFQEAWGAAVVEPLLERPSAVGLYNIDERLWFPSREGIYTYRSVINDPK